MTEQNKPLVLIVDDDLFMQDFLHDALEETCRIITADSGKTGLEQAHAHHPTLMIADIQMPEMDGFELCRNLKDDFDLCDIPVLFLSALDRIEDRLQGFEVGGEDFLAKPINPKVLEAKVSQALRRIEERQQLKNQSQYATNTAMLAMTSMSETGVLLEGLKRFNYCKTPLELAKAVVDGQALFNVNSIVQLLLPNGEQLLVGRDGPGSELEAAVINHMASMDRITQFKTRLSISYPFVRTLITNMPIDDLERCGRLRDHLAMLIEAAEVRLEAINTSNQSQHRGTAIEETIKALTTTMANIDDLQRTGRASASIILSNVMMRVEEALVGLQLTERQEASFKAIIHDGLEDVSSALLAEAHFQDQLSNAIHDLQKAIAST